MLLNRVLLLVLLLPLGVLLGVLLLLLLLLRLVLLLVDQVSLGNGGYLGRSRAHSIQVLRSQGLAQGCDSLPQLVAGGLSAVAVKSVVVPGCSGCLRLRGACRLSPAWLPL